MPVLHLGSVMDSIRHNHHWYNIQMHKKLLRQARQVSSSFSPQTVLPT